MDGEKKGLEAIMAEPDEDDEDLLFGRTLKVTKELKSKTSGLKLDKKMSSRFAELGNLYMEKKMSINFHKGFRDLNPTYHKMRHERAVKVANRWLGQIKANLEEMHYNQARKNFNDWINEGNKLTYEELQKLKDEKWKMDYIQRQLLDDVIIQEILRQ